MVEILPEAEYEGHYVQGDLKPYRNIVDGKVIEGRRQHEDFLKRNNCEVYEGPMIPEKKRVSPDPVARRELIWETVDRSIQQHKRK